MNAPTSTVEKLAAVTSIQFLSFFTSFSKTVVTTQPAASLRDQLFDPVLKGWMGILRAQALSSDRIQEHVADPSHQFGDGKPRAPHFSPPIAF